MGRVVGSPSTQVAIALGSNLGDREAHLRGAVAALSPLLDELRVSRFIETDPVGVGKQPPFLNAALVGRTTLSAGELLRLLLEVEVRFGRTRSSPGAARTLDLDLIFFGDARIEEPRLSVPHPRFRDRLFVLEPLAEVAASLRDPVTGLSVADLLARRRGTAQALNRA